MQIKIRVSKLLFERLSSPDVDSACLYGYKTSTCTTLIAATRNSDNAETELLLPAGLELLGRYSTDPGTGKQEDVTFTRKDGNIVCFHGESQVDFDVVDTRKDAAMLRVKTNLLAEVSSSVEETESHWEKLHSKVHSEFTTFHLTGSKVVLLASDSKSTLSGAPQDVTVEELALHVADEGEGKPARKSKINHENPLDFSLYWSSKIDETAVGMQTCAPVFYHQKKSNKTVHLSLPIDVVAIIPWDNLAEDVGNVLAQAVCKQLQQIRSYFMAELKDKSPVDLDIPKSLIFMPDVLGHFVSMVIPGGANDDILVEKRIALHEMFFLKLDRPVFKLSLKHWFPEDYRRNRYLINVHQGLHHPNCGESAIVRGRYAYHHYLQDNAEDNGWGCAYRSLQTIISWFRLQGYTDKPVPTHKEIQQCLVDIGDKPASFVGSRQWIGSMEVSFCLQSLIGVESSILNVSSGAELASKGRQIAQHFRTHGTPIMIGGGVLAHTILGIDFNEDTGDAKFLILDPHYTGGEDLNIIQNKGWCGWKPATFWDSSAFYNLCMPHRPSMY